VAERAFEVTLAYIIDRKAWPPIGTFQNSRFKMAIARTNRRLLGPGRHCRHGDVERKLTAEPLRGQSLCLRVEGLGGR